MPRLFVVLAVVAMAAAGARAVPDTAEAQAPPAGIRLPVPQGQSWRAIQGYNGGTHTSLPERYALDLVREDGPTGGADVLAPAAGTLWFMHSPGSGNGCLSIRVDGSNGLIVQMCHIIARPFAADQRIDAGQVLGTVGHNGAVGNNGLAHIHLSMHRTPDYGVTRIPAPFALPDGLPLEGISMPADGTAGQYGCPGASCRGSFVSTNGAIAPAPPSSVAVPAASTPPAPAAPSVPLRSGVVARVAGAGDCANAREAPSLSGRIVKCLPDGTTVTVADGPVSADGRSWWKLDGLGWTAGDYLAGVSAPTPSLRAGGRAVVDAGQGDCLNVRETPGTESKVLTCLPSGARVAVAEGPREAGSLAWWRLDGHGWVAAMYLQPRDD